MSNLEDQKLTSKIRNFIEAKYAFSKGEQLPVKMD